MLPVDRRHEQLVASLGLDEGAPRSLICSVLGVGCILASTAFALVRGGDFETWLTTAGVILIVGGQVVAAINASHRRLALMHCLLFDLDLRQKVAEDRMQVVQLLVERISLRDKV
jgi:flagellar motor component MotA